MTHPAPGLLVDARPQPLALVPEETAVIVVDMQNDFGAPGGMFDRAGVPLDGIQAVVAPTRRVLDEARRAGMRIVYLTMEFNADLSDAGGPDAPNLQRHLAMGVGDAVTAPDGTPSRVLIRNTWNTAILPELTPQPGDIVVSKHRFSGFYDTDLDARLRAAGITTLVFTGCTTGVCVESTVRDAFFRDYRSLVLADCVAEPIRGDRAHTTHDASLQIIQAMFGWVSDSETLLMALAERNAAVAG